MTTEEREHQEFSGEEKVYPNPGVKLTSHKAYLHRDCYPNLLHNYESIFGRGWDRMGIRFSLPAEVP